MAGIAGTVILYHPDEQELLGNIDTYLSYVEWLVVIDNTPNPSPGVRKRIVSLGAKSHYVENGYNRGIAAALNQAAGMAKAKGYTWLLTMDQDSCFERYEAENYFSSFQRLFFSRTDMALVSPTHGLKPAPDPSTIGSYLPVVSAITSGSLLSLGIWDKIGGFDEKLFIDEVDHEYCYRARANNFQVMRFNNITLQHRMGRAKRAGYFGLFGKRERMVHDPARLYFIVRNYLYVRHRYRKTEPEEFRMRDKQVRTIIKNNLFFSGKFSAVLRSILKGYSDYRKGDFSKKMQ